MRFIILCSVAITVIAVAVTVVPYLVNSRNTSEDFVSYSSSKSTEDVVKELATKIANEQIKKSTPVIFPYSFYQQKGSYPSHICVNFYGFPESQLIRNNFKFLDSNVFVTLWITSILLEVTRFDKTLLPSDDQLLNGLRAISSYHDKNNPKECIFVFWPQTYNETVEEWQCGPVNLNGMVNESEKFDDYIRNILKHIGLEKLWDKEIQPAIDNLIDITNSFEIPADFDDTFINIGLGSILKTYQTTPDPYQAWLTNNTNISSAIYALKKYAYRPLSQNSNENCIDPRSYFYLRDFIHDNLQSGKNQLSLATTWIQSISEDRVMFYKGYRMPFNVNNVDLTVCTNVIYGLTSAVLSNLQDPDSWFDDDVQMIYDNTTLLIAYEISNNFSSRPDLALTYYPSIYNFYWFTARTLSLLNSQDSLPYPVLERAKERLNNALRNAATNDILKRAQTEKDEVYFDDFLGDADKNIIGETVNHGDDRICSTSMAINALFYTWSDERNQLASNTPTNVKGVLSKSCNWLAKNALSSHYEHMNAFFSGSVKSFPQDIPFYFPMNFVQYLNGTDVPPSYVFKESDIDIIASICGVISPEKYDKMTNHPQHGGFPVPLDFHGYNNGMGIFPFWSSDTFTYASSLLALVQCDAYDII